VTITDAGPSRKKLKIEIPAAAVSERMKDAIDAFAASATRSRGSAAGTSRAV
jgi:hypothetical protein